MHPLGTPIPPFAAHAVSVSLPTWLDNVRYEQNHPETISALQSGYPRFLIHAQIAKLNKKCSDRFGLLNELALIFPSRRAALECRAFIVAHNTDETTSPPKTCEYTLPQTSPCTNTLISLYIVLFHEKCMPIAKQFWQHTGEGISSRFAAHCLGLLDMTESDILLKRPNKYDKQRIPDTLMDEPTPLYGPYPSSSTSSASSTTSIFDQVLSDTQESVPHSLAAADYVFTATKAVSHLSTISTTTHAQDSSTYIEERFGRNLLFSPSILQRVKSLLRKRIAGTLGDNESQGTGRGLNRDVTIIESDVFLFSCGMSAIYNSWRVARTWSEERGTPGACVQFGFPYTDTLKILQRFHRVPPEISQESTIFLGHGDESSLLELEKRLQAGQKIIAVVTEFPSNPLLKSPPLTHLRRLADTYDFLIIVDETVGNIFNVCVIPYADIVVSSLTKIFSGESNVMGGSLVLNPSSRHYLTLKTLVTTICEDNTWCEDLVFLERNSRNFVERIKKINQNTEFVADLLKAHPYVKQVYYPKYTTPDNYKTHQRPHGGYGGLLSVTFHSISDSVSFYDALPCHKGPSLGTNFTLACPYTILAHFLELDMVERWGVERGLVRVSVGLEDVEWLRAGFSMALDALKGPGSTFDMEDGRDDVGGEC